jgi:hypothetical protein
VPASNGGVAIGAEMADLCEFAPIEASTWLEYHVAMTLNA